jgi:alkyldihydroxyacetonephosphate synthase
VLGSEGTIGVITEATVKIQRIPEAKDYRGYLFGDFASGVAAAREIIQARLPVAMVRLSDENETHFFRAFSDAQKPNSFLRRIKKTLESWYLKSKGVSQRPCLMIVGIEGRKANVVGVSKVAGAIAKKHKALAIGPSAGKRWFEGRFHGPYARDPMLDHGLGADTLETSTRWSNILHLQEAMIPAIEGAIREGLPNQGARGIVMGHISHTYTDGASLYYTFVFPRDLEHDVRQWRAIKKAATESIVEHGGTISHHHGVGTDHADWMVEEKGPIGLGILKAVKDELDEAGIMNPGKLLP